MTKAQLKKLEADLWHAADTLRANSDLKASEYSIPGLGIIFLRFADSNYRRHEAAIVAEYQKLQGTRREKSLSEIAIEKCGFYLPDHARYDHLLHLPEAKDIAKALKAAFTAIEEHKPELDGVLPKDGYVALTRSDPSLPRQLLRTFADIPATATGDLFGQIYEYFLAEFARSEGQKGGEVLKLYYASDLVGIYRTQSTGISNCQFESFLTYQTLLIPPAELQAQFDSIVGPMIKSRDLLSVATIGLRKTRDFLLPRLISGKLPVESLPIAFPPSMAAGLTPPGA